MNASIPPEAANPIVFRPSNGNRPVGLQKYADVIKGMKTYAQFVQELKERKERKKIRPKTGRSPSQASISPEFSEEDYASDFE